jgi:hypothetical protein
MTEGLCHQSNVAKLTVDGLIYHRSSNCVRTSELALQLSSLDTHQPLRGSPLSMYQRVA